MFRTWLRLFGLGGARQGARRHARLSEAEALAIAHGGRASDDDDDSLHFTSLDHESGELIWTFSTSWRGARWVVRVRDRDGRVMSSGSVGFR